MGGDASQHDVNIKRGVFKASKVTDSIVEAAKNIAANNFGEAPDPAVVAAIIQALAITHASMISNPTHFSA